MIDLSPPPQTDRPKHLATWIPAAQICLQCGRISMMNGTRALLTGFPECCGRPMYTFMPRHDDRKPPWPHAGQTPGHEDQ